MATFTNQATLSYNGTTVNSNVVTGQMVSPLTMTKTAVVDTYFAGDSVTYVVSIINTGSSTFEDLTLTDDLGGYEFDGETVYPLAYVEDSVLWFINGTQQENPTVTPGAPLVISGISVPAGGNATIIYETTVTGAAPLAADSEITNTAVLTGQGISCPVEAQAVITVVCEAELTIAKSLFPATVEENGQLTYTFDIRNHGNTEAGAAAGVTVSDLFDPILNEIKVELNGAALAQGTGYTYNQQTGQFQTVAGQITVPAAEYTQDETTGEWMVAPGEAVLTVCGTVRCPNS